MAKMSGYFICDSINFLHQHYPNHPRVQILQEYANKPSWSPQEKEYILDFIAECLSEKNTSDMFAQCFSPILLELFFRILKNQKQTSLFCTLGRLIGSYACATNFAYQAFSENLFDFSTMIQEIHQSNNENEDLLDFLESCYIFLNFDLKFFTSHFDWKFIIDFLKHQNNYYRYLSIKIYSKLIKLDPKALTKKIIRQQEQNIEDYRLKLFNLSSEKYLKFSNNIQYRYSEACIINDKDFSQEIVCVKGILLPSLLPCNLSSSSSNLNFVLSKFENYLRSISLGVSLNKPILVEGPMSCGKSTLITQLAHLVGRQNPPEIMTIQISDQVDAKYLLGSYICSDISGEFLFNYGPLLKAIKDGNWIVLEDIDAASSELISSIVSIIESRNSANIANYEGKIEKFNKNFRIFFTRNIQKSDSMLLSSVNFKLLEKICYVVQMECLENEEIIQLISSKWPDMRIIIQRIISIYENLINFYSEAKAKRRIWLRDLMKWCNRLSKYLQFNDGKISEWGFLDAIDCFNSFYLDSELSQNIAFMLGSEFNLSKPQCKYLLKERNPKIFKENSKIIVGRQSFLVSKLSKYVSDFAFTINTAQLLEKLLVCVSNQEYVLLCGETGVGKTSSIQYLANLCGKQLSIINMNQQSSSGELFGGYKPIDFKSSIDLVKEDYQTLFRETFSHEKNDIFENKLIQLYHKRDWKVLLNVMIQICANGLKKSKEINENLFNKWNILLKKLMRLKNFANGPKNQLMFIFLEGILTNAIQYGHWILLDEINLAENETLQSLLSFMENDQTLILFEKSHDQIIKVHEDFRLFACMNPATDIGKKELPMKIRSRFTEFFIDEIKDPSQLRIIVTTYIQNLVVPKTIEAIVEFYFQVKLDAQTILKDMNGHRPIFSLRNLCRALRVTKDNPIMSIQRSLYEGFSLAFLSNLDHNSYKIVRKRIEDIIFPNINLLALKKMPLDKIFSSDSYVIIENFPIIKGPNSPVIDETYILTSTVTKNLCDICRIISAGRTYPILLQGETSVGKTSLIQWLAKATGNICHRVNNHEHTDLQEYLGSYCSEPNGQLIFKKGILVEAMKNGHWIILDELNLAPTEVLEALNRVLDENREIFIPECQETLKAHPRFLLFATQNPPGKYGGRKILSRAFRNRFIELNFSEIPLAELEIILHKKCAIPLSYSKRMVSVLNQLQQHRCKSDIFAGKNAFITLRDLFRWGYRYMKFSTNLSNNVKFYDWNKFLMNQGYMLLAGRVRNKEDIEIIKNILESSFRSRISVEELFYGNNSFEYFSLENFNKNIVWTKSFKRLGTLIHEAIEYAEPILLVGETGCGKTMICQYFAAINHKDLKIINCHMNTESSDFLGSLRPNRNVSNDPNERLFEWVDGPLVTAMKNGDYFLVDEISLADDSVLERLNSVLELERTIFLAENSDTFTIQAEPTFRYFATMNPGGDFGKKELSPALRDRFTEIWCPFFEDFEDIQKIIFQNLQIQQENLKICLSQIICDFIKWFNGFISKYKRFTISIRDILSWINFINRTYMNQRCLDLREAFKHGAYLVFIDPLANSNINPLTNINMLKKSCEIYLNMCSEKIPNEEWFPDSLNSDSFLSIGPFSIEKIMEPKKSLSYFWKSCGVKSNSIRVLRALQLDKPILLEGPPGVGKTSLIQALANASGHSLIRINLSDQTDISDLFGCDLPMEGEESAGKFMFRDGPFLTALKTESTWILLDELNLASQTVLEGLNACLDHRGEIYISELNKTFYIDKCKTRIFASQNPFSIDGTRKGLPKSFLNRFSVVYIDDLDKEDFQFILSNLFPTIPIEKIQKMVNVNQKICDKAKQDPLFAKKGGPFEFNLRDLIRWAQTILKWNQNNLNIAPEMFFDLIYTNKMRNAEDKNTMKMICFEEYNYLKKDEELMFFINDSFCQFGYSLFKRNLNCNFDNRINNYIFDKQKSIIESVMKCIEMNWLTILIGDVGQGKSHIIKLVADIYGNELNVLHVNPDMDTIDLLGGFDQKDLFIDLKNLEDQIIEHCFQLLFKNYDNFKLAEKFFANFYELKNSKKTYSSIKELLGSKIEIFEHILDLFENDEKILTFRNIIENYTQIDSQPNNGKFEWRDSSLIKSIQTGGWVLIENANFLNPSVLDRLNSLLEPGGSLVITEKGSIGGQITCIYPHENFRLFLTMNPQYGELSRAMRNRGIEIVLSNCVKPLELNSVTLKHGITLDCQQFSDYNSFVKLLTESVLKNQHGYVTNSLNQCHKENIQLINLNTVLSDPNLYYTIQNYLHLKFSIEDTSIITKTRIFFENANIEDFQIRFKILKNINKDLINKEELKQEISTLGNDLQVLFNEDIFNIIKTLPIDFRENQYIYTYIRNNTTPEIMNLWNKKLNHFHLTLFWMDLKYRLSLISNANSLLSIDLNKFENFPKTLIPVKKFLSIIFEKLNVRIINSFPNDEDLIKTRKYLVFLFQLLSICSKTENSNWEIFLKEEFFPLWFLLTQKNFFGLFQNDLLAKSLVLQINSFFFENSQYFDNKKCNLVRKLNVNYFHFKSHQDIEILQKFKNLLKMLKNITVTNKNMQKINNSVMESVTLLIEYFNRQISFEHIDQEFYFKKSLFKNDFDSSQQLSQCIYILSKLFSSYQILDYYMNKVFDNERIIDNKYFTDPYFIFFQYLFKNHGIYNDVMLETLFNINEELNFMSLIKCFEQNRLEFLNHLNDDIIHNLTCELMPLISIIYFNIFDQKDTIKKFQNKRSHTKFYSELLSSNYYYLKNSNYPLFDRFVSLAKMLHEYFGNNNNFPEMVSFIQNKRIELITTNEKVNQCFEMILIGYGIASFTVPDYPIDPVALCQSKMNNYHFQVEIIEEELNMRHDIYKQMYHYHDEKFHSNLFIKLRAILDQYKEKISDLQHSVSFRRSKSKYFDLVNDTIQFQSKIFNWIQLKQIMNEIENCFQNAHDPIGTNVITSKCLTYFLSITNFINRLQQAYIDYQDITTSFILGMFLVLKGLQILIYHLQSLSNRHRLFREYDSNIVRQLFQMFSEFVSIYSPSEICRFIFKNNIIEILWKSFQYLNLDEKLLVKNLLELIYLEIKNSIYLGDNQLEMLSLYFKMIDIFVQQWKKIEMKEDLENLKGNALFHIRLQDNEDSNDFIEEVFPSFEKYYPDVEDSFLEFFQEIPKIDDSKDNLLFIAHSHLNLVNLLENPPITISQIDFMKSYLNRYRIISNIFKKTLGFIQIDIESQLIDGHLFIINFKDLYSNRNDETLDIYHLSIDSEVHKCYNVLENLRTKIQKKLLPEFPNHPTLIKLLNVIDRIYLFETDCSLLCLATGLEIILKISEDWQLIAHQGISLVEHLNEITELLISWRKMEINYWVKCLDIVLNKIEDKQLMSWWLRFYTAINDLTNEPNNVEQAKEFIKYVKKYLEDSTLGQFSIRLRIVKVFIYYLKCSRKENEFILMALQNIYNFYNNFLSIIKERIFHEKTLIEKEIQEFINIAKWNPKNFWSLKNTLTKSKKQLYSYVKKYEMCLSKSASALFQFEKKLSIDIWKLRSTEIYSDLILEDFLDDTNINQMTQCEFISNANFYIRRSGKIFRKIKKLSHIYIEKINNLEELNNMLIDGINNYSNLNVMETKDSEARKKIVAQIQNQKRRALSDMFKKLSHLGLSFRKGIVHFGKFDLNETIYSMGPLNDEEFQENCKKNIQSCNTYYYKCLSGYSKLVLVLEKPNSQLTVDMLDRIKGYSVNLAEIVFNQRKMISKHLNEFNKLNKRYLQIKNNFDQNDRTIIGYESVKENIWTFQELIFKFYSFVIRLKGNLNSIANDNFPKIDLNQFDVIIQTVKHIIDNFQFNNFIFYTESSLEKFKIAIERFKLQIENLFSLFNQFQLKPLFILNSENLFFFQNQCNKLEEAIHRITNSFNPQSPNLFNIRSNTDLLLKNILLCFERTFKNMFSKIEKNSKFSYDENLIKDESSFTEILKFFNAEKINSLLDEFFKIVNQNNDEFSMKMIKILIPFYTHYIDLFKCILSIAFGSLKTSSKLLHLLLTLFNELLANGFCLPPELEAEQDSKKNEQEKNIENAGFGAGNILSDAKDVSDRLESQDQLDDLNQNADEENDNFQNHEDNKNGIEMDDNFDGQEYGGNETDQDDKDNDESSENEDNLDDNMGNVDDDEQILDEKMWANESDEEDNLNMNKDSQLSGGQENFDSQTVSNQDNERLNYDKDINKNKDQNEEEIGSNEEEEKFNQQELTNDLRMEENFNENNNNNNENQKIDEMILPENIQLEMDNDNEDMDISDEENPNAENLFDDNNDEELLNETSNEITDEKQKMEDRIKKDENEEITNELSNNVKNLTNNELDNLYANRENSGQSNENCLMEDDNEIIPSQQNLYQKSNISSINDIAMKALPELNQTEPNEQNEYSMSRNNKKRSQADEELSAKKQKLINAKDDIKDEQEIKTDLFTHVEQKSKANDFAYDIAIEETKNFDDELERGVNFNDNESIEQSKYENNENIINKNSENEQIKNLEKTKDDISEKEIQGDFAITSIVTNNESSFHIKNLDKEKFFKFEDDIETIVPVDDICLETDCNLNYPLWIESEKRIEPLLYELCNQLQFVLEPNKRAKYKGDFKNGKRLNMRKVISYIASQFRKDKIWLRRTKPSKRQYQIIIAVDDSLSMSDNKSKIIAFESLMLLGKSLSIIESGLLSVLSFGEEVRVVHPFGEPFTDKVALKMFSKFKFNQKRTKINELLKCSLTMFADSKQKINSNAHQLLLIISDGRGIFSEGIQNIQLSIMKLKEMAIFSVFTIIDNPEHKNSIMDIRVPIFKSSGNLQIESYIEKFPFPYYIILKDINSLPSILSEALRQWFELIAYDN